MQPSNSVSVCFQCYSLAVVGFRMATSNTISVCLQCYSLAVVGYRVATYNTLSLFSVLFASCGGLQSGNI